MGVVGEILNALESVFVSSALAAGKEGMGDNTAIKTQCCADVVYNGNYNDHAGYGEAVYLKRECLFVTDVFLIPNLFKNFQAYFLQRCAENRLSPDFNCHSAAFKDESVNAIQCQMVEVEEK